MSVRNSKMELTGKTVNMTEIKDLELVMCVWFMQERMICGSQILKDSKIINQFQNNMLEGGEDEEEDLER